MMRMDSQVQQDDGFTPGQRVFGRAPKFPICAIDNPFFEDFTNPVAAPATKTQNLISAIYEIRQASSEEDFQNKMNSALIRRVRNTKNGEFVLGQTVYL